MGYFIEHDGVQHILAQRRENLLREHVSAHGRLQQNATEQADQPGDEV